MSPRLKREESKNKVVDSFSLPTCAEGFVGGAYRQGERFPFSKHLTGDVEVRAVLLVEAREPQHGVFQQRFVALLLPFPLQTASGGANERLRKAERKEGNNCADVLKLVLTQKKSTYLNYYLGDMLPTRLLKHYLCFH